MTNSQPSKTTRTGKPPRTAAPAGVAEAPHPAPAPAQSQLSSYEAAMRRFHARQFREAREAFRRAAEGPERDIAQRSRLHIQMCDRRLEVERPAPLETAEDHYNYAVAMLNTRKVAEARLHLARALEMAPGSDHIHYAMALAQALSGDLEAAGNHLGRAIELEPHNRVAARQDADFAPFVSQPPLLALVFPEKRGW